MVINIVVTAIIFNLPLSFGNHLNFGVVMEYLLSQVMARDLTAAWKKRLNRMRARLLPWWTPMVYGMELSASPTLNVILKSWYIISITDTNSIGIPYFFRTNSKKLWLTVSNAFTRPTKSTWVLRLCSLLVCKAVFKEKRASWHPFEFREPHYSSIPSSRTMEFMRKAMMEASIL